MQFNSSCEAGGDLKFTKMESWMLLSNTLGASKVRFRPAAASLHVWPPPESAVCLSVQHAAPLD